MNTSDSAGSATLDQQAPQRTARTDGRSEVDGHLVHLRRGLSALASWRRRWLPHAPSATAHVAPERVGEVLDELVERLRSQPPFFHPDYAAHMVKPPHEVAQLAYSLTMQLNPNNHAVEASPATTPMEREVVAAFADMFQLPLGQGHLTTSGTAANLEALWVANNLHPGRAIAFSSQSHYTHSRMCRLLGVEGVEVATDARGRMSMDDLALKLERYDIGTVVATAGTTGLGAIDPIDQITALAAERDLRVHVDGAYGGYFRMLADSAEAQLDQAALHAIRHADSVVIDPHKHGMQPYGCGCVLFRSTDIQCFYNHEAACINTLFANIDEVQLGEISLECSRSGAAAAALWATMQCLPLSADDGHGPILAASRRAALEWARLIGASDALELVVEPQLDTVTFLARVPEMRASTVTEATERVRAILAADPVEPVYVAELLLPREIVAPAVPDMRWDQPTVTVFRACLLKPEHEAAVASIHARVERAAATLR